VTLVTYAMQLQFMQHKHHRPTIDITSTAPMCAVEKPVTLAVCTPTNLHTHNYAQIHVLPHVAYKAPCGDSKCHRTSHAPSDKLAKSDHQHQQQQRLTTLQKLVWLPARHHYEYTVSFSPQ
jgi:hypothetical protein